MLSLAKEKAAADIAEIETVPTPAKKQKTADIPDGKDSRLQWDCMGNFNFTCFVFPCLIVILNTDTDGFWAKFWVMLCGLCYGSDIRTVTTRRLQRSQRRRQ